MSEVKPLTDAEIEEQRRAVNHDCDDTYCKHTRRVLATLADLRAKLEAAELMKQAALDTARNALEGTTDLTARLAAMDMRIASEYCRGRDAEAAARATVENPYIERLKASNDRLRAALREIAEVTSECQCRNPYDNECHGVCPWSIATAALSTEEER